MAQNRTIGKENDVIEAKRSLDTLFAFNLDDLTPVSYVAETKNLLCTRVVVTLQRDNGHLIEWLMSLYKVTIYLWKDENH